MSLTPMSFDEESKPLAAGVYSVRVIGAETKFGKESGKPYINWSLELFGSPDVNGKRVYHMTPTTGPMVSKLAEFHKAATGQEIDKKSKEYDGEMLVGKELTATVIIGSYQGKEKPEVKAVAPLA